MLERKVAVVYGGGGVIGGAIARVFAREGAHVYLVGRTRASLNRVVQRITGNGGRAEATVADAADELDVRHHLDDVIERAGRLDILVNAVGIRHVQGPPLAELGVDQFMAPVVGYPRTLFVTTQAAAPHLVAQRSGVFLTWSTPGARLTGSGFLGIGVASAAVEAFSRILAGELGPDGVRVVCIRPHAIPASLGASHLTDAFDGMAARAGTTPDQWLAGLAAQGTLLRRLPTPEDVAEYAAFASSDRARTMTGTIANLTAGSIVDWLNCPLGCGGDWGASLPYPRVRPPTRARSVRLSIEVSCNARAPQAHRHRPRPSGAPNLRSAHVDRPDAAPASIRYQHA